MDEEEEVTFHGTKNPEEAKIHTIELEKAMDIIEEGVKTGNTTGLLEAAINKIRATLVKITPHMETANVEAVLRAIKDTACTALMPSDSDHEETLEAMMPETEMATLEDFLSGTDELGDITEDQKELMGELFEELETSHESMARACSTLGEISQRTERQTTPTDITGQRAATSSGEHSWEILERHGPNLKEDGPTRWLTSLYSINHDTRRSSREHQEGKWQQPDKTACGNTGIPHSEAFWPGYDTAQHAGTIWSQAQTDGPLHHWPKVSGWGRTTHKEKKSIRWRTFHQLPTVNWL